MSKLRSQPNEEGIAPKYLDSRWRRLAMLALISIAACIFALIQNGNNLNSPLHKEGRKLVSTTTESTIPSFYQAVPEGYDFEPGIPNENKEILSDRSLSFWNRHKKTDAPVPVSYGGRGRSRRRRRRKMDRGRRRRYWMAKVSMGTSKAGKGKGKGKGNGFFKKSKKMKSYSKSHRPKPPRPKPPRPKPPRPTHRPPRPTPPPTPPPIFERTIEEFNIGYFTELEEPKELSTNDMEAIRESTELFFQLTFQDYFLTQPGTDFTTISVSVRSVELNEKGSTLGETLIKYKAVLRFAEGSSVPSEDFVLEVMSEADFEDYLENYVRTLTGTPFEFTAAVSFRERVIVIPIRDFYIAYEVPDLASPPSDADAQDLLRVTEEFFDKELREWFEAIGDIVFDEINLSVISRQFEASFPEELFNFLINFEGNVTFSGEGLVPSPDTLLAIMVQESNFIDYIMDYVRTLSTFLSTKQIFIDAIPGSFEPSSTPSLAPSRAPTQTPGDGSQAPSATPSVAPSMPPSVSVAPSGAPTISHAPSISPAPTSAPTLMGPTRNPSASPSTAPSGTPSGAPSVAPSLSPSVAPSPGDSILPTISAQPSTLPTISPAPSISSPPSLAPSSMPSVSSAPTTSSQPSSAPTISAAPTTSALPSMMPSSVPSTLPTDSPAPSAEPSGSAAPSGVPSAAPSPEPSTSPSSPPSVSVAPSQEPSMTAQPSEAPSSAPNGSGGSLMLHVGDRFEMHR